MQAIGTRVEGGALIHLGRLAEGAALMAAALPDPQRCFAASFSPVAVRWVGLLAPVLIWHGAWDRARLLHADGLLDRQQQDHAGVHAKFAQALAILERLGADNDADRLRQAIAHTPA